MSGNDRQPGCTVVHHRFLSAAGTSPGGSTGWRRLARPSHIGRPPHGGAECASALSPPPFAGGLAALELVAGLHVIFCIPGADTQQGTVVGTNCGPPDYSRLGSEPGACSVCHAAPEWGDYG